MEALNTEWASQVNLRAGHNQRNIRDLDLVPGPGLPFVLFLRNLAIRSLLNYLLNVGCKTQNSDRSHHLPLLTIGLINLLIPQPAD